MDTGVKSAVKAAGKDAQYDEKAKKLLGQKNILAWILVKTVDEFKEMNPKDVVPFIEGEPKIGIVPVEPGMTNAETEKNGQKIVGLNTENSESNEGLIRFDIVFYVRMPSANGMKDGLSQIIVNVEAQKEEPITYYLMNRAVFYVSRLISSQKERDFVKSNYNDIRRVFSIWVCMNMDENSLGYVHLTREAVLGSFKWKGGLNLINIVMIGLSDILPEHNEEYELHRLLGALLSKNLSVNEKLEIIEKEYSIPLKDSDRKEVQSMCNLGEGIRDDTERKFIMNMYNNHFTLEQIALASQKSIDEVEAIIKRMEPVLA